MDYYDELQPIFLGYNNDGDILSCEEAKLIVYKLLENEITEQLIDWLYSSLREWCWCAITNHYYDVEEWIDFLKSLAVHIKLMDTNNIFKGGRITALADLLSISLEEKIKQQKIILEKETYKSNIKYIKYKYL